MSHVNAVQSTLRRTKQKYRRHATSQQGLSIVSTSRSPTPKPLAKLRAGADEFSEQGGARMIATLGESAQPPFAAEEAPDARRWSRGARSDAGDGDRGD